MADKEQIQTKVNGRERFYLDTTGYATLAKDNPNMLIPAMSNMYGSFLDDDDPIISNTLNDAQNALIQINNKNMFDNYNKLPEEGKKKIDEQLKEQGKDMKDPGQVNEYLMKSLNNVEQATSVYSEKRNAMIGGLTCSAILDYFTRKDV